ncbi:MAG: hypothetical protein Q8M92_08050, partial [Candidatus Subteraquimicrobiales bacterium]|nr:hypothetical protein [Candidatus Subteraquimicrobiales bacterium]
MATRFNKAKNVELNTSEECRECKGWVKAGYKLFGEMTGFVCRDCYPQYINDYPIKGKRVTLGSDISAEHFPPNIISEDNDSTSLSRFRWQFLSALA